MAKLEVLKPFWDKETGVYNGKGAIIEVKDEARASKLLTNEFCKKADKAEKAEKASDKKE